MKYVMLFIYDLLALTLCFVGLTFTFDFQRVRWCYQQQRAEYKRFLYERFS